MMSEMMGASIDRSDGVSKLDTIVIRKVLNDFFNDLNDIYDERMGTIVLDAQPIVLREDEKGQRPSIRHLTYGKSRQHAVGLIDADGGIRRLTYGEPRQLMKMHYPSGPSTTIFFDSEKVAAEAIDSLLEGKRVFYGHANASLNGNIYKTSGDGKTYESGHLMILNATYGRFLVGCGDVMTDSDKRGENDFIFIAIARILSRLFEKDEELQASFDWIRRASGLNYYLCDTIINEIDNILAASPKYLHEYHWRLTNESGMDVLPFE